MDTTEFQPEEFRQTVATLLQTGRIDILKYELSIREVSLKHNLANQLEYQRNQKFYSSDTRKLKQKESILEQPKEKHFSVQLVKRLRKEISIIERLMKLKSQGKSVIEQHKKPRKSRQKKKSPQCTMSEDQSQTLEIEHELNTKKQVLYRAEEQLMEKETILQLEKLKEEISITEQLLKQKPHEKSVIEQHKEHRDQQESTTISENKDHSLEGGLGMPIIRATLSRFTVPPKTVFLTMEDLEFINPNGGSMLRVEEIYYDNESPDVKAQQDRVADMERGVEALVLDPNLPSERNWIKKSKVWDLPDDDVIRSRLESEKGELSIYTCGISGKGCGTILRDSRFLPIVARSKCLPDECTASTFYSRLNGVALGVKTALDFKLKRFFIYVPSFHLYNFMRSIWDPNGSGKRSNCIGKHFVCSLLHPEDMLDFQKIYLLTRSIISDLDQLRYRGMTLFKVQPVLSIDNKAAELLANLGSEKDMRFADIFDDKILSQILYDDAVF